MPFADTSVHKVPKDLTDEDVIFLADILPTAYEVGVLAARVEPGDTVAVVGAGPIGLAAVMTAKLFTPGRVVVLDIADARLVKARELGAAIETHLLFFDLEWNLVPEERVEELLAGSGLAFCAHHLRTLLASLGTNAAAKMSFANFLFVF